MIELRQGHYADALAHVRGVDAVISDPPYTKRTMVGFRSGSDFRAQERVVRAGGKRQPRGKDRPSIPYAAIDEAGAVALASWACARARHWIVLFNDHEGWNWLAAAIRAEGWYVFSPVIWYARNSPPRFQGDGPNNPHEYIVVARPRRPTRVGSIHGHYNVPRLSSVMKESAGLTGQKPLALMRAVLEHYSRPGWTVCDPFAGSGSTLIAAHQLGRRAIGAELDPATHAKALDRIVQHVLGRSA